MKEIKTIFVAGNEIEIPEYMVSLPQSFIDILKNNQEDHDRIISCGVDPSDDTLYFITFSSYVGFIKSNEKHRLLSAFPSWNGDTVYVSFEDELGIQGLNSSVVKRMSTNAVTNASISIGGRSLCGIDIEKTEYEKRHGIVEDVHT